MTWGRRTEKEQSERGGERWRGREVEKGGEGEREGKEGMKRGDTVCETEKSMRKREGMRDNGSDWQGD